MTKSSLPPSKYPSPVRPAGSKIPQAAPVRKGPPAKKGK